MEISPPTRLASPTVAKEFHLAITREQLDALEYALSPKAGPNADEPERGAYCVITQVRGRDRISYLVHEVIMPDEGDVYWPSRRRREECDSDCKNESTPMQSGLQYSAGYRRQARRAAQAIDGGGLLIFHTHPHGSAEPNEEDRRVAIRNLYGPAQNLEPDAPLAAGLYSEEGSWHVRSVEIDVARTPAQRRSDVFGPHTATTTAATAIRIVGQEFEKRQTTATEPMNGPAGTDGEIDSALVDSSRRIWGLKGQRQLAGLRVGITGAGGGGSILAEWLARLGVGELVLVDYDRLEAANYNRHQGARPIDIREKRLKVRVSARVAKDAATAQNFRVRPIVGSVVEAYREKYDPLPHLLDCDIIINAADMHWARKVLDNVSYTSLIPLLDGGSQIDVDENDELTNDAYSTISLAGPGHACLRCADAWTPAGVAEDKEDPQSRSYVGEDETERAPSVISMNGSVESLVLQRFQALVLGVAPELTTGVLRYKPANATLRWRQAGGVIIDCFDSCDRPDLTGTGEAANKDLDRFVDPILSEDIESGALDTHGVVEPAPIGPIDNEEQTDKEGRGLLDRLRQMMSMG